MTYMTNSAHRACRPARFGLLSFVTDRISLLRQRQTLKSLDAQALDDIGLTRDEALTEANRSIWDAPDSWKC